MALLSLLFHYKNVEKEFKIRLKSLKSAYSPKAQRRLRHNEIVAFKANRLIDSFL